MNIKQFKDWEATGVGNYVKRFGWGILSYNPDTAISAVKTNSVWLEKLATSLAEEKSGEETALYDEKEDKWMILSGDFRKQYDNCRSLGDCLKIYQKNIKFRNNMSV